MKISWKSCALLLLFIATTSFAQWVPTSGPAGGYTNEIFKVGSVLITSAGNGGVYKSVDNGVTWSKAVNGLPAQASIQSLSAYGDIIYVSVYQSGVYKSEDMGESWLAVSTGIESMTFYSLYDKGSDIYAGNANGGVYFSADNGNSWSDISNGLTDQVSSFTSFNSMVYTGGASLYEYNVTNGVWDPVTIAGLGLNGVRSMTANDSTIYVADDGNVFISRDTLKTWSKFTISPTATITSMGIAADTVFLTTSYGRIYYSVNDGANWTLMQNFMINGYAYGALFLENKILMTTDDGIYASVDGGGNWSGSSSGMNVLQVKSLLFNGTTLYSGTERQGVFKSLDDGASWMPINQGLDNLNAKSINNIFEIEGILYIGTNDGVYTSNDGASWTQLFTPGINKSIQTMDFKNGVFAAGVNTAGVYISLDTAKTWSLATNTGLNTNTSYYSNVVNGDTMLVSTHDAQIWLSTDGADSWSDVTIAGDSRVTYKLVYVNSRLFAATTKGLFISDDLGTSWTLFSNDSREIKDILVENDFYYAVSNTSVLKSTKDLNVWYDVGSGLTNENTEKLIMAGTNAILGTFASSVWLRPKAELNIYPIISGTNQTLSTSEDTPFTIALADLIVTDPDNSYPTDFSLTIQNGSNYSINNNEVTPDKDFFGSLKVKVVVNDGIDDSPVFEITIDVTAVNDLPVITGSDAQLTTYLQTPIEVTFNDLNVTDPDNSYPTDFTVKVQSGQNYTLAGNTLTADQGFIGELTVPVTVNDGTDDSLPFNLLIEVTDVLGLSLDDAFSILEVYPNPASGHLQIMIENEFIGKISLNLLNTSGKLVYHKNLLKSSGKLKIEIPLENIPSGVYIVNVISDGAKRYAQRLIIE